jgi:hypothetical protein
LLILSERQQRLSSKIMMNNWTVVGKGRVRPPRGAPGAAGPGGQAQGDGRGGGGGGGAAAAAGGGGGGRGAPRPRTKLPSSDTKPNIYDRPNTVVIDGHEFSVLPPIEELVPFIVGNVLREEANKEILQNIVSLFCDENTRKYLLRMKDEKSTEKLAELLAPGVPWPGYRNEEKNRDVIIHGYSMEKPVMEITISGIGWWTPETVVRSVVDKWGDVKECARSMYTHLGHAMETDQWKVKLVKNKNIIIPPWSSTLDQTGARRSERCGRSSTKGWSRSATGASRRDTLAGTATRLLSTWSIWPASPSLRKLRLLLMMRMLLQANRKLSHRS